MAFLGSYKRSSRFIFNAFSRTSSSSLNSKISGFRQPLKNQTLGANNKVLEPLNSKGKRFKLWKQNPRILLLGCGVVISTYYWNLERVPYTKRSHFVLFSTSIERDYGENVSLEMIKSTYEGKILPPLHPLSIRVQRIGQEIVEAAQKGLRKEEECVMIKIFKKLGKRDYHQIPQFEWEFFVVDDPMHYGRSYPGGKLVLSTGLLDSCNSDAAIAVIIGHEVGHAIARHVAEIFSRFPVLKIFKLFLYWSMNLHLVPAMSKLLTMLPYSRRILSISGEEMEGPVRSGPSNTPVLVHSADKVCRLRCPTILKLFLYWKTNLSLIPAISKFLIRLPYSRRREKEADYIGLILVALAGYDPRVVVEFWEEDGKDLSDRPFGDYVHSHPSNKKRAQLLSQPTVMEEALSLYIEVLAQRGVHIEGQNFDYFRRALIKDKM
ncbi:hypothetical protein OROMI_027661 [Orobanche minor]